MNTISISLFATVCLAGPAFAQGSDGCVAPTPINSLGTVTFDTTAATSSFFDGGGTCGFGADTINQDLFFVFTAPVAGDFEFDTVGSSYDTEISVHLGPDLSLIHI